LTWHPQRKRSVQSFMAERKEIAVLLLNKKLNNVLKLKVGFKFVLNHLVKFYQYFLSDFVFLYYMLYHSTKVCFNQRSYNITESFVDTVHWTCRV
jgi:hypothetical protein